MIFNFRFSILDWVAQTPGREAGICSDSAPQTFGQSRIENPKSKIS